MTQYKKYKNKNLYGSNTLGAKEAFEQRKAYDDIYPSNLDPGIPSPIDFRLRENYFYGSLDLDGFYIIPNINYLEILSGAEEVYVLDFVADAYKDFLFYMNTKASVKMKPDEGKIKDGWKASRGWKEIDIKRSELKDGLYLGFVNGFLDVVDKSHLNNFKDFLNLFINSYMQYVKSFPLTYSGFYQSKLYDRLSTGLCVDIYKDDLSEDKNKFDKFINNINFKDFSQAAAGFGFIIDKHAPFRLVANMNSPKMFKYLDRRMSLSLLPRNGDVTITETPNLLPDPDPVYHTHEYSIDKYGNGQTGVYTTNQKDHSHKIVRYNVIPNSAVKAGDPTNGILPHSHFIESESQSWSMSDFYNTYYYKLIDIEIDELKNTFFNMFKRFTQEYPNLSVPSKCDSTLKGSEYFEKNSFFQKTIIIKKSVNSINRETFDENYDDLFWTKTYFLIRLHELGVNFDKRIKANVLAKIEDLYLNVDKKTSLVYINNYLRQFY